jgi:hypothetical protein
MAESREQTETHPEDREQGTPQGQLLGEEPTTDDKLGASDEEAEPSREGGADSAADAAAEGG